MCINGGIHMYFKVHMSLYSTLEHARERCEHCGSLRNLRECCEHISSRQMFFHTYVASLCIRNGSYIDLCHFLENNSRAQHLRPNVI